MTPGSRGACATVFMGSLLLLALATGQGHADAGAASVRETDMMALPNPFRFEDGSRVVSRADWARRREEIKDLLLRHQYGRIPPAPVRITALETAREDVRNGAGVQRKLTLTMGPPALTMRLTLSAPLGDGPFPVILRNVRETAIRPVSPEIIAMINDIGDTRIMNKQGEAGCEMIRIDHLPCSSSGVPRS